MHISFGFLSTYKIKFHCFLPVALDGVTVRLISGELHNLFQLFLIRHGHGHTFILLDNTLKHLTVLINQ
jgi:hypothetical protein